MTIKISQLGNVATIQGNVLLPIVSNITGTLTTVQANLDQLGTYILGNAGNITPLASNTYSLGNSTTWWKDLWISNTTIYIGGVALATAGGKLTLGGANVGTTGLDTYTGNVSAGNISVGSTTVGNTTTTPTFSVEGSTGNITAGNISAGNITSTGDFGAASVSTPTVSSNTVNCGAGGVNFIQGAVDSVTLTNPGTEKGYNRGFVIYPTGGTGTGFSFVIKETTNPESGSGSISVWEVYNPGQGYTAGDELTFTGFGDPAEFIINAVNDVGTLTAGDSTWSFDPTGDTTVPGNISLPDNTAIYNVDANTAVFTSNVISDATSVYLTDEGNVAVYASGSVVLETNSDGNVSQQWAFNDNGNLILPYGATLNDTANNAVAFGLDAGTTQGISAVAIGNNAGVYQGAAAVAIGDASGGIYGPQGSFAVAVGQLAGGGHQGESATAIGAGSGYDTQGNSATAIGASAGYEIQGQSAVAIGAGAGYTTQGISAVAIGDTAGSNTQGNLAIAIGSQAASGFQLANAIAIGTTAGHGTQGLSAIAIGAGAGQTNQANNSIIINATNSALNMTTANTFTVAPVRNDTGNIGTSMYYNTTTKEVTYTSSGAFLPTYSGNVGSLQNVGSFTVFGGNIQAGFAVPPTAFGNIIFNGTGLANSSSQLNIQNVDSVGTNNSADIIATAPNGTDTSKYIDMGINGNNFVSSAWTISGKNDGYVYINQGNLTLGTDTPNTTVKVHVGGTLAANVVATFSNSNVTIGGNLIPGANVTYSLGSPTQQWKDLYVSNNTIYIGGTPVSISGGSLSVGGVGVTDTATGITESAGRRWFQANTINFDAGYPGGQIAFGGGGFLATMFYGIVNNSSSNAFAYSTDAINWTYGYLPYNSTYGNVNAQYPSTRRPAAYGANGWVIPVRLRSTITSADGITWTNNSNALPAWASSYDPAATVYGNGVYVLLVSGPSTLTSTNGTTWANGSISTDNLSSTLGGSAGANGSYDISDIAFGGGVFIAVGGTSAGNYTSSRIFISTDGKLWSNVNISRSAIWNRVGYGDGVFVAVTTSSNLAIRSTDNGTTWSNISLPVGFDGTTGLAFGSGTWSAVRSDSRGYGYNGNIAISTDNGITWANVSSPDVTNLEYPGFSGIPSFKAPYQDIAFGKASFVAIGLGQGGLNDDTNNVLAVSAPTVKSSYGSFTDVAIIGSLSTTGGISAGNVSVVGNVSVGNITSPSGNLTISGNVTTTGNITVSGSLHLVNVRVPILANSAGTAGQITWDSSYVYICIATDTWKRANISTW